MYASRMRKPTMLAQFPGRVPFIHSLLGCIQSYLSFTEPDWVDVKHEKMNRDIDFCESDDSGCESDIEWGLFDVETKRWYKV